MKYLNFDIFRLEEFLKVQSLIFTLKVLNSQIYLITLISTPLTTDSN